MEKEKFKLPAPVFSTVKNKLPSPHFASAQGMLLPKEKQPPPMFGPNGATIPAKYLEKYKPYLEKYQKKFEEKTAANNKLSQQKLWCENCDFLFKNKLQLDKHLLEYSNCTIGDCSFVGCSRSVAKHIQQLHTTGLYDKIKNLNTPEEIEKWREERKKRYPTMANVQLRQKVNEERKKRGERIENNKNRFGPKNDTKKSNSNTNDNQMLKRKGQTKFEQFKKRKIDERRSNTGIINNKRKHECVKNNAQENVLCSEEELEDEDSNSVIPKFQGTSSISDYIINRPNEKKIKKNVLAGLVGMYGDSSDSDESESNDELDTKLNKTHENLCVESSCDVKNLVNQRIEENVHEKENYMHESSLNELDVTVCQNDENLDNDIKNSISQKEEDVERCDIENQDIPDEQPILRQLADNLIPKPLNLPNKSEVITIVESEKTYRNERFKSEIKNGNSRKSKINSKIRKPGFLLDYSKLRKAPQNTLLEKLLEPQIRHERNVLLQCVRYVVNNSFFGIGQTEEKATNK